MITRISSLTMAALWLLAWAGCEKLVGIHSVPAAGGLGSGPADGGRASDAAASTGGGGGAGGAGTSLGSAGGRDATWADGPSRSAAGDGSIPPADADAVPADGGGSGLRDAGAAVDVASARMPVGPGALVIRHSGKCLDTRGPITPAGNQGLKQTTCDGSAEQTFAFKKNADGTYVITPAAFPDGGVPNTACLDVENFSVKSGAYVIAYYKYNATGNQKWIVNEVGGDYFKLSNQTSGLCLEVFNSVLEDTGLVQQWDCQDRPAEGITHENQMWRFVPNT